MIKLIACDLDGTVLDSKKVPDSGLKETVGKLREKGINFTLVSGRNEEIMDHFVDYFELDLPYVTNNGGNIYQRHKCLLNDCSPQAYNNFITRLLYENDIAFNLFAIEGIYGHSMTDFFEERQGLFKKDRKLYTPDVDLSDWHIYKLTCDFAHHPEKETEVTEKIRKECPDLSFLRAEPHVYCANSATANKGEGLQRICDLIGISPEEVMAFGDNGNDLPMLKRAGIGVAMGNAQEDVRSQVSYVCKDNDHNGVSEFLKGYFSL